MRKRKECEYYGEQMRYRQLQRKEDLHENAGKISQTGKIKKSIKTVRQW